MEADKSKLQYQYTIRVGRRKSDTPDEEWEKETFENNKEKIEAVTQNFLEEQIKKTKSAAAFYNNMARGGNEIAKNTGGVLLLETSEHDPLEELLNGKSAVIDYEGKDGRIEAHYKKPELMFRCFATVGYEMKIEHRGQPTNLDRNMGDYINDAFDAKGMYLDVTKIIEDGVVPLKE